MADEHYLIDLTLLSRYSKNMNVKLAAKNFSIAISDWQTLSAEINNCKYYAEIIVVNVSENDNARVDFAFDSIDVCQDAGIYPAGKTENGKIIIYSKEIPSADINGIYTIQEGVSK